MANTLTLHYTEQGQGTPLVLLHGYPFSSAIWHEQQQRLSDYYRVITPDLRGHGQSPVPMGVYEMETIARDVLALLDTLHVEKAAIMGHSMGGYATLAAWRIAPERFLAFGLISSVADADIEERKKQRYQQADRVEVEGSKVIADLMIPLVFAPGVPADESIVDLARNLILTTKPDGIVGTLRGMAARPSSIPLLPTINVPALIMTGDQDQLIASSKSDAMAAAIPHATLVTIENAGHMPMLEQPQAVTMAIRNFMDELKE